MIKRRSHSLRRGTAAYSPQGGERTLLVLTGKPQAGTVFEGNLLSSGAFLVFSRIDKKAGNSYDPSST